MIKNIKNVIKSICLKSFCTVLAAVIICGALPFAPAKSVRAYSGSTTAGETIYGDYVLVLNKSSDSAAAQPTGALVFDASGSTAAAAQNSTDMGVAPLQAGAGRSRGAALAVTAYSVGAAAAFPGIDGYVYATCIAEGNHCYIWMENSLKTGYDSAGSTQAAAAEMIRVYEAMPYQTLNELSGGAIPCRDGSGKLSIIMEIPYSSPSVSGYYVPSNTVTAIHVRAKEASSYTYGSLSSLNGLLAHEGQHALFYNITAARSTAGNEALWMNEGLSVGVMDYLWGGYSLYYDGTPSGWLSLITSSTSVRNGGPLIYNEYRSDTALDYSLPYLFMRYLADQCAKCYDPLDFFSFFYTEDLTKYADVPAFLEAVMAKAGLKDADGSALTFEKALENFYIACTAMEPEGVYGFYNDASLIFSLGEYPLYLGTSGESANLYGTGALILKTNGGSFCIPEGAGEDIVFIAFNKSGDDGMPAGSGTEADPYLIADAADLFTIFKQPDKYYKLTANIDLSGTTYVTCDDFAGDLNGAGYTINGLRRPLFNTNDGSIRFLSLILDFDEDYSYSTGGFAKINNGSITDCNVTGSITGSVFGSTYSPVELGALAGENSNAGSIERCWSNTNTDIQLPLTDCYVGELCGVNNGAIINCYTRGAIALTQPLDGDCDIFLGGICGKMYDSYWVTSLKNTYSTTSLSLTAAGTSLDKAAGRLVGSFYYQSSARYIITSNYALSGLDPLGKNANAISSFDNSSKTAAELKAQATFAGWDFAAVWKISEGNTYPSFITNEDLGDISVFLSRTSYYTGEKLDLTGAYIIVNGNNINLTEDMLDSCDTAEAGTVTVSGSYLQKPFYTDITVTAPASGDITGLTVFQPAESSYIEGSAFDPSELILAAVINGQTYKIYSGYTCDKTTALSTDDTEVTYTYCGQSVSQDITVSERAPQSLSVISAPEKTAYTSGDMLDLSGLSVQITYNDGSKSAVIAYRYFADNGIKIFRYSGGSALAFDEKTRVLIFDDNGASFYVCTGSVESPTASARIGSITVYSPPVFPTQNTLRMTVNAENYAYSEDIGGGSGDFTAELISGSIPSGINAETPSAQNNYQFIFSGAPQTAETCNLVYRITDSVTGRTLDTTFTLNITAPSDECLIESFIVPASLNSGKISADVTGVIDRQNSTIALYFPAGTDVSAISAMTTISDGATIQPWNGTVNDYSGTNTVTYTVTAENNTNSKTYTVSAYTADSAAGTLAAPAAVTWNGRTVVFSAVPNASGYNIRLYREVSGGLEIAAALYTTDVEADLSAYMTGSRPFIAKVNAVDTSNNYAPGEAAASAYFVPVTNINLYSAKTLLPLNETLEMVSEILPANATVKDTVWSVADGTGKASVDNNGTVTPISAGTVTVTVSAADGSGLTADKVITVTPARPASFTVVLTPPNGYSDTTIYLDGEKYTASSSGTELTAVTADDGYTSAVMYRYNANGVPVGMYVWLLDFSEQSFAYTAAPVPALENILSYHGFSVRVKGITGIRFKTGIATATRSALLSADGLDGFKLTEYGTCVMTDANRASYEFVKGGEKVSSGRSYWNDGGSVKDYVFETVGGRYRFTSVLVNIAVKNYKTDYAFRGYIVLNKNGVEYTLYGPPVSRSMYTVANQVLATGEFAAGSQADIFLKKIITDADNYQQ